MSINLLHNNFYKRATFDFHGGKESDLLALVEAERQEVAFLQVEVLKVAGELLFAAGVVTVTAPYFAAGR